MTARWKLGCVLVAVSLTLCAPIFGPVGDSGSGPGGMVGDSIQLNFAASGSSGSFCLNASSQANAAAVTCTAANYPNTTAMVAAEGTPEVTGVACWIPIGVETWTVAPGATVTVTPEFVQYTSEGVESLSTSTLTATYTDDTETGGNYWSAFGSFTSSLTGPQALRVKTSTTGTPTVAHIACAVNIIIH